MKEGDIYFWRWKVEPEHRSTAYWCLSQKAVFTNGKLRDCYWGYASNHENVWTPEQAKEKLMLEFKGNINDMEPLSDNEKYYDRKDIVNMTHANMSRAPVYKRKGAKRNRKAMLEIAKYSLEKRKHELERAQRDYEELKKTISDIEGGCKLDGLFMRDYD